MLMITINSVIGLYYFTIFSIFIIFWCLVFQKYKEHMRIRSWNLNYDMENTETKKKKIKWHHDIEEKVRSLQYKVYFKTLSRVY